MTHRIPLLIDLSYLRAKSYNKDANTKLMHVSETWTVKVGE